MRDLQWISGLCRKAKVDSKQAIAYISKNGPVSSDMLPIEGEIFWHSSMHWSGNWDKKSPAARSILEQLYTDGELVIHHKKGSRKYYDLAAKHLPEAVLQVRKYGYYTLPILYG